MAKSIATNSVQSEKYKEPEITKKEQGKPLILPSKICEQFPFKESEYNKIKEIIKVPDPSQYKNYSELKIRVFHKLIIL